MKINFTKNEYRLLIEMLTIADWVMQSRSTMEENNDKQNKNKKYIELRKNIFSYHKEFDAGDIVSVCNEDKDYHETDELLDHIHDNFMSIYDEDVFWDELIHKLALRDTLNKIGSDKYEGMDVIERMRMVENAKIPYVTEFEHHGLKNVIIKLSTEK